MKTKPVSFWKAKELFLFALLLTLFASDLFAQYPAGSPVAINGKLRLVGTQLSNECGNPVQLRGMSTHGPQWFPGCYNTSSLDALVRDWGIDVFRIAMYVREGGYLNNPSYWRGWIDNMVNECGKRGIYCMIDWHILSPGDPWADINAAREFWTYMSAQHANKKHVLYEICNEPNGVDWNRVKTYAEDIIPRIRANDPSTIIIVGTPTWSQDVDIAANNRLNYSNIMYTLHFYSGSHGAALRSKANTAISRGIGVFVTEFGTSLASGDGGPFLAETQTWIDWMAQNKISWINWSFADKAEVSAALSPGACGGNWNNTSQSGTFIKQRILSPADNFSCNNNNPPPPPTRGPYGGTAVNIPGKVEAERYDTGGNGVAYNDITAGNSGSAFRTDDVDIEATTDVGGGFNVGWTAAGEWMEYTVNVTATGTYNFDLRVAATAAGKSLRVDIGGTAIGTVNIPNTGGWQTWTTVTIPNVSLTAGQRIMRIFCVTDGFNLNFVEVRSAGTPPPPNQAPTVAITSPANNASFTAPASITINANASDADGSVTRVEFFNGTTKLGEDLTSPYSFTWSSVAAGTYSITARATDNAGAVTTSAPVSVAVGSQPVNQPPTVSITSPANNASFNAPATISIAATASDADGSVSRVEFFNGTTKIGEDLTSPYTFLWSNVAAGTYSITARATDNLGTVANSSAVTVTVNSVNTDPCPATAVPPATQFVLRNDWSDQNSGSVVTNTADALRISHRQWGRNMLWAIQSGRNVTLQAGRIYTVTFSFLNDAANPVSSIDVGFGNGVNWDGPVLTQPVVSAGAGGSSSSYTTRTVNITSTYSGTANLVIRFNWPGQPNQVVNLNIRNLSICSGGNSVKMAANSFDDQSAAPVSIEAVPNPFEGSTYVQVKESYSAPVNFVVNDLSGMTMQQFNGYTNERILVGQELPAGVYVVQATYEGKTVVFRIVKN